MKNFHDLADAAREQARVIQEIKNELKEIGKWSLEVNSRLSKLEDNMDKVKLYQAMGFNNPVPKAVQRTSSEIENDLLDIIHKIRAKQYEL